MAKSFGDYLVEQKLVSPEQMVVALIEQHRQIPFIPQLAFEKKIFTANELLQIFNVQQNNQVDFFSAGNITGLMTPEKRKAIEVEISQYNKPLVNILIRNGFAKIDELVMALDDYLSKVKNEPILKNPEEEQINHNLIVDLKPLLSKSSLSQMHLILNHLKAERIEDQKRLTLYNEFLQKILAIKGLAILANAKIITQLCTWIEKVVSHELKLKLINESFDIIEVLLNYCALSLESIIHKRTEKPILDQINQDSKINDLKTRLSA